MSVEELFAEPTASAYRRVALLGDLSVVVDGRLCRITAPKQRAVLAHLALEPGVAVSADRLLTNIWGDDQPAGGPKAVAFQVTKLRDALEPERVGEGSVILTSTSGYLLDVDPRSIDLHDAAAMIDDAAASLDHDPAKAAGLAEDAMAMWRGVPFADVLSSPVLDDERRRIDLLHQRLQVIAHEAGLALGEHAAILPDIAQLAARHPLDEQIAALYLRALDGSGRTADALRAYGELRDRLVDELGIDPSPELQRLELSLLEREAPPPTRATSPQPAKGVGLPAPTTSLVGRVDEIEAIVEQLADDECRSLTLLGPGGVGKTRLAIAAASRWADLHRQPVWFCALAGVDSTSPMIEPFAAAVGFTVDDHMASMPGMDDRTQFLDYLAGLSGLLVVDNAEHVGRVPALVADIAARCPDVTTLVTSRERLATSIEWVRIVAGLRSDADQDHAAALFAARARQAGAVLSGDDRATITRICVATDGLPMALELSAALAGGAELVEIADRLERDALTIQTDAVDIDPRHASLSATFEASWALLDPDLRDVLARLSVFPGPFTADAAREIAEAGASTLARLVMKSLVRRPGSTFDLHPLIRQFAAAKLTSPDATRQAHSTHYLERVAGRTRTLLGAPDQMAAVAAVDDEIEHIRAAAMWQAEHLADVEADVRLTEAIHALSAYGFVRSEASWSETLRGIADRVEVAVGPERALAHASYLWARAYHGYPDAMLEADGTLEAMQALEPHLGQLDPKAHAWCLMNQAICTEAAGDIAAALELMERAVEVPCEDEPLLYAALTSWHGWELSLLGRHAEADEVWQRGLAHAAESQNETARAYLLSKVGLSADDLGNHALALQCHEESVRLFEPMGNDAGLGYTFSRISWTQRMLGNTEEAITAAARGLEHFENVSHRWGIGVSYGRRGHAHLDAGHHGMAVRDFADCITWGAERQVPTITWYGLVGIALTLVEVDAAPEAVELLAHNVAIAQNPYAPGLAKPALDELEGRLDDDVFAEARRRGEAMSMEQAVAVAMGWVHRLQD